MAQNIKDLPTALTNPDGFVPMRLILEPAIELYEREQNSSGQSNALTQWAVSEARRLIIELDKFSVKAEKVHHE